MTLLLDSTFLIDHLRAQPEAIDKLGQLIESAEELYVNDVVTCELWAGAHDEEDPALEALLRFINFVQPGPRTARLAGRLRADARRRGHTLATADALIAAAAIHLDGAVLTRNVRDFALTPVRVETY